MSRVRKPGSKAENKPKRRITAPIDEDLFRWVGAFCKYKDRPLGDVVQTALLGYLKTAGWRPPGETTTDADEIAA